MKTFYGTGVAMITPFKPSGAVDTEAIHRITNHLIDGRVEYLVVLGSTGEAVTQTDEEQDLVIRTVMEANAGRIPMVLGAGGNDTLSVCKKVKEWTEKYNPDGFLSVSPMYNKPSQEGIFRHFSAVAESTDKSIILYNVPGRTSSNMNAETTIRIAKSNKNVVAIKEASGNVEQCMKIQLVLGDSFTAISGDDALAMPLISAGYKGVISVAGNAIPRPFTDMVRLALAGNFAEARILHYRMFELMQLFFAEGNPSSVKVAMELLGLCERTVRLPLIEGSAALEAEFKMAFERFGN